MTTVRMDKEGEVWTVIQMSNKTNQPTNTILFFKGVLSVVQGRVFFE